MKKINVVGGGPAGMMFAILTQEAFPLVEIRVYEGGQPDEVEGWGIVLNMGTINLLQKTDPKTYAAIKNEVQHWSDVHTYIRDEFISVKGKPYISISRKLMTNTLRRRCEALGIPVSYGQPVSDLSLVEDCDLLVGADGAFSVVREQFAEVFKPEIDIRPDYFTWLGTTRVFPTITHIFRNTEHGVISAEGYVYADGLSTFIPVCNPQTWRNFGFDQMSRVDTINALAEVFRPELGDHEILSNQGSRWRQFPLLSNQNWFHPKVLLLGDALHTAHFSIGSGTRLALEDAVMAVESLTRIDDQEQALRDFEQRRKPYIERYQKAAFDSLTWYEQVHELIDLAPIPFAFETMTRSDKLGIRSLKLQDPEFVSSYQNWLKENPNYQ